MPFVAKSQFQKPPATTNKPDVYPNYFPQDRLVTDGELKSGLRVPLVQTLTPAPDTNARRQPVILPTEPIPWVRPSPPPATLHPIKWTEEHTTTTSPSPAQHPFKAAIQNAPFWLIGLFFAATLALVATILYSTQTAAKHHSETALERLRTKARAFKLHDDNKFRPSK